MNTLSRDDAAKALNEIGEAGQKIATLRNYRYSAPYFLLWGTAWLVANGIGDLMPATLPWNWLVVNVVAIVVALAIGTAQFRGRPGQAQAGRQRSRAIGWRFGLLSLVICLFFVSMFTVIGPLDGRQVNAFISLFWVFLYMGAGLMFGWRLFVIGAVAAAGIMFGYLYIHQHFDLWMGVFGGGALIAGGLWLRRV